MSKFIKNGEQTHKSRLITALQEMSSQITAVDPSSKGVFGSKAKVICGDVNISSDTLDVEFSVKFDDDMESNEAEITVYNLSDNTINRLKRKAAISIEAGFDDDVGVIFSGFIDKVTTSYEDADKITTIRCFDDVTNQTIAETTYAENTTASYILKDLLNKTGTPIAVFSPRRDWTYENESKVSGSLMENIKRYSEVCGVSTFVKNGKIYVRYIKEGDATGFTISEDTGMIGSPSPFEEEQTAEDYKETVNGYEVECLLQHRFSAGAIVNLKSLVANGQYRIQSGQHTFSIDEAVSKVKLI